MKKEKFKKIIKKVLFILFVVITCSMWILSLSKCYHVNNFVSYDKPITHNLNRSYAEDTGDGSFYYYDDSSFDVIETGNTYHYYYFNSIMNVNYLEYDFTYSSNGKYVYLNSLYIDLTGDCYYLTNVNSMSPSKSNISTSDFGITLNPFTDTTYNTNQVVGLLPIYDEFSITILQGCLTSNNNRYVQLDLAVTTSQNINHYTYRYNVTSDWGYGNYAPYYNNNRYSATISYSAKSLFIDYYTRYDEGYNAGVSVDSPDIYDEGYNAGLDDGYNAGIDQVINNPNDYNLKTESQYISYGNSKYQEGYNENATYSLETEGFMVMFNSIMNAPFNIFSGILEWEFMGVNLFNLFTFIFTSVLVIWVIKLFV